MNKCNKSIDLVVALDSSESVREANWTKLIRFTKALVKSLDASFTRVGIIRYNTKAEVPIPLGKFIFIVCIKSRRIKNDDELNRILS